MSRISVVIPCHNYGRFLAEAFDSVAGQTRPADEIVIVDDGSTDETAEVIEVLRSRRPDLVVVARQPARGAATTFNDGVLASSGDLLVVLSADDRMSPRYLELLERALGDGSHSFAYCSARTFGAEHGVVEALPFDAGRLMVGNYINGSAMITRRLFDDVGGWRPGIRWEDWEFWVHAVGKGHTGTAVDGCWLEYRRHAGGSRDTGHRLDALRGHLRMWRMHRPTMRLGHVAQWLLQ